MIVMASFIVVINEDVSMNKIKLFHTSPVEIKEIHQFGRFGTFLFFSPNVYQTHVSDKCFIYSIEIDDCDIVKSSSLFTQHDVNEELQSIINDVAERFGISEDAAMNLIDETEDVFNYVNDPSDAADESWDMQCCTAKAAVSLGYKGVRVKDEQGESYMIEMSKMIEKLTLERVLLRFNYV